MTTDFLIIGGGPAGLSAALFLARAKRKTVLIQKGTSSLVKTLRWFLPGFSPNVNPLEWLKSLRSEAEAKGVELVEGEVKQATLGATEKRIITADEKSWEASVVILATGCYDRHGLIEGEEKFAGHGVYYNAYQDGLWFDGKTVVVEGKNEPSIREAIYLSRFASKIYFIVPAMKLEGPLPLVDQVQKNEKIEVWLSASIKKIEGNDFLESVTVLTAGEEKKVEASGVFLYSRPSIPQYEFLKGTVEISEDGCVLVDENFMTSIPGVFACGDILAGIPQLPFVSAAQGLVTAIAADRYLTHLSL